MKTVMEVIRGYKPERYLEIGIFRGDTLFRVKARLKVGVDPCPQVLLNWLNDCLVSDISTNSRTLIFCEPSDNFFSTKADLYDLVFVDGLHDYKQAVRDIENGLRVLREGGVVLVHDTNPLSEKATLGHLEAFKDKEIQAGHPWNGDVWKAVLEFKERGFEYWSEDVVHGLTVFPEQEVKSDDSVVTGMGRKEIMELDYSYFDNNRAEILRFK